MLCPAGWYFYSSFLQLALPSTASWSLISIGLGLNSFWEALLAWGELQPGRVKRSNHVVLVQQCLDWQAGRGEHDGSGLTWLGLRRLGRGGSIGKGLLVDGKVLFVNWMVFQRWRFLERVVV